MLDPRYKDLRFLADKQQQNELWSLLQSAAARYYQPPTPVVDVDDLWGPEVHTLDNEIQSYKAQRVGAVDPLEWWKVNETTFPTLALLAKRYLCIPASSAPCERVFSKINVVIAKRRARLLPERAEQIVFIQHNMAVLFPDDELAQRK